MFCVEQIGAMMRAWKIYVILCSIWLSGCTNLQPLQDLQVSLVSIEPAASQGITPSFNINLLISNPNEQDLQIQGIAFNLEVADKNILSGVSNQIPTLKSYTETPITLSTSINLFDLLNLVAHLSQHSDQALNYRLNTKIDPKGFVALNIENEGVLNDQFLQGIFNTTK